MKISRVKIYLKFSIILKSLFNNFQASKIELSDYLKKILNKNYLTFFGMCRTCFIVTLEFLKTKYPKKNKILICSYNLEEMIEIAKLLKFDVKFIDLDFNSGVMDINLMGSVYLAKYSAVAIAKNEVVDGERGVLLFVSSVAAEEGQRG